MRRILTTLGLEWNIELNMDMLKVILKSLFTKIIFHYDSELHQKESLFKDWSLRNGTLVVSLKKYERSNASFSAEAFYK